MLPVSVDGGFWSRWKADGLELFSRPENDDRQPHGWPATFDVTADGERFLVTELVLDENIDPTIAIIPNWSASLE
jgi:hypothetical protein